MSLIGLPIFIEEILLSTAVTLVITLIYKFLANQEEMRMVKATLKEKQSRMKELQKTNPKEANAVMSEVMSLSSKQMKMNMKPMFSRWWWSGCRCRRSEAFSQARSSTCRSPCHTSALTSDGSHGT